MHRIRRLAMCTRTCFALLMSAMLAVTACRTTPGRERVTDTQQVLQDLRVELTEGKMQIDRTMMALKKLSSHQGDLTEPYEAFVDQMDTTASQAEEMKARLDDMKVRSKEYFDGWTKDTEAISNVEMRKRSEARRAELMAIYKDIENAMQAAGNAYQPFISDLQDIQRFLEADLSGGGVEAISDLIQETDKKAKVVNALIQKIIEGLQRAESAMSTERR
jgi:peptidoglycan hydrolase CwlO-like protein